MAHTACFHCGEALPGGHPVESLDGTPRAFCCHGCAGAARWIRDAGLGDYYRIRDVEGLRVGEERADYSAWDRADVLAGHSRETATGREITVLVEGMRCAACAWLIDRALRRLPGIDDVRANAVTGRVVIAWNPDRMPISQALEALASIGYRPHLAPGEALERERRRENRTMLIRLGVAGLGMLQAMMFAEALYLDFDNQMPVATRDFFRWIAFLLATPVVFYSGWPFISGMLREVRFGRLGMDTLVASSVLLAYGASLVETLRGGPHVWIDAAVMFVFLLLAARALEAFARHRANAAVDTLSRARPALAWRLDGAGRSEQVPLASLAVGDIVRVPGGETVPADGVLLDDGEFDEALLTGESHPVPRRVGEPVLAGSSCRGAATRLRVERTGQDTRLSHLVRLVEEAQNQRPRVAQVAEAFASRFVVSLFVIAALVFATWWHIAPERAFEVMLAVLVISCPCALSLAIPTALGTSHGALARLGVLSLRPDALDTLARADALLIDKTGTLTDGSPSLVDLELFGTLDRAQVLASVAALERESGHPLAAAFRDVDVASARRVVIHAGRGVEGEVAGRRMRVGRADFAAGRHDDGAVWLGDGFTAHARLGFADRPRADAAAAVTRLDALGLPPEMLTGDSGVAASLVAGATGIGTWRARQSPEDKLARVRQLQSQGRVVAMIGDGINDAPVLAGADVSIAMAGGAALAHRSADLVLAGSALERLPDAIELARRTRRIIRQNLAWAGAYNVIALPFAAAGLVTPWIAALGMAGSSLLVTFNALRLARARPARRIRAMPEASPRPLQPRAT
ncbi:heavy metal translocating P-type ATPase [Alkalisalibacterium limincola]|uniref:Cadmium-translocating P-type ATPase n=1 Tax=Alkalisalibacterium limincola TaxID=2699169 RepID=A0A5C8KNL5_9GAMM|nr:heavy metal translocating P-type ATPase [Alkalisalibacterium limincola]TXK62567.1 cadmium-translocating P-type ATPase [Alkalisalibacterium limincola]